MYETQHVKIEVERGLTFTLTRHLPYIASILFTRQWKSPLMSGGLKAVKRDPTVFREVQVIGSVSYEF